MFCVDPVPNARGSYFAFIAYDLDLFEPGSIANLSASTSAMSSLQAPESVAARRHASAGCLCETSRGRDRHVVERERLDKFGRPLLGATVKPKLGLSGRTMAASSMRR